MVHAVDERAFVEKAQPHSWFQVADDLHAQAVLLYQRRGNSVIGFSDVRTGERLNWDATNRTTFLLAGFSLENAIKAFLVYENPSWISNGRLSKQLRSHKLTVLAAHSKQIPHKLRGRAVLGAFEGGLDSWARYPCALRMAESHNQAILTDILWKRYLELSASYGRRLKKLLSRSWSGPHAQVFQYHITGEYLGCRR
jgi:hypothetical protein